MICLCHLYPALAHTRANTFSNFVAYDACANYSCHVIWNLKLMRSVHVAITNSQRRQTNRMHQRKALATDMVCLIWRMCLCWSNGAINISNAKNFQFPANLRDICMFSPYSRIGAVTQCVRLVRGCRQISESLNLNQMLPSPHACICASFAWSFYECFGKPERKARENQTESHRNWLFDIKQSTMRSSKSAEWLEHEPRHVCHPRECFLPSPQHLRGDWLPGICGTAIRIIALM